MEKQTSFKKEDIMQQLDAIEQETEFLNWSITKQLEQRKALTAAAAELQKTINILLGKS